MKTVTCQPSKLESITIERYADKTVLKVESNGTVARVAIDTPSIAGSRFLNTHRGLEILAQQMGLDSRIQTVYRSGLGIQLPTDEWTDLQHTIRGHTFLIRLNGEGIHTGRPRFRIDCLYCSKFIHESTTGPLIHIRIHLESPVHTMVRGECFWCDLVNPDRCIHSKIHVLGSDDA